MTPREIHTAIYSKVHPYDVTGAVLQQEMILYCGKLIATLPSLFTGILVLRMDWLVHSIQLYREFKDINVGPVDNIPPSQLKNLLIEVLENTKDMEKGSSNLTHHQTSQINGCLMRVPPHFYSKVWQILKRCPGGLRFGSSHLPQLPTIDNMNMRELAFSHLVEGFFVQNKQPEYRQVIVQLISILATILQRNPEISFKPELDVDQLIQNALSLFLKEKDLTDIGDMSHFYTANQATANSYLARSVVNTLLVRVDLTRDNHENCSVQ
jgi:phosphorylase kinase alpha/beta subunit